ncbi:MAG: tetratricopeptide repeat protein, partial [Myxococcota bacterium]
MFARNISIAVTFTLIAALGLISSGCGTTYTYKKANELPLKQVCDARATPRGELLMDADCGVQLTRMTAESACDAGNGDGCALAALLTLTGESVDDAVELGRFPGDSRRARKLAHRGCQRNNEASCLLEAVTLLQDRSPATQMQGVELMQDKCAEGMGDICFMMGSMYEENATTAQERSRSVTYYKKSCTADSASGCFKYAQLLEDGFGVQQSHLRAEKYYDRACDLNHAEACSQVGRDLPEDHQEMLNEFARVSKKSFIEMMRTGCENGFRHGCTFAGRLVDRGEIRTRYIGHEAAVELFEIGCERGAAASCYYLAYKTKNGQGTEANTATAASLAEKACDSGHEDACELHRDYTYRLFDKEDAASRAERCATGDGRACYLAGHAYGYDVNFDADYDRALELLNRGCELDYADACESAGVMLADEETGEFDLEEANGRYARACELGADYACFALGMIYEQGRGVERQYEASSRFLRLACERDVGQACGELGSYYEVGEAVEQDLSQAEELYSRGCAAGNINSCTNLASLLRRNTESKQSFKRALDLYKLSCANDEPRACVQLGNMLTEFSDDKELVSDGMDYLERACMLEHGPGCRELGVKYYRGDVVEEDHGRALMLWQQACDQDDPTGCIYLGELYRDGEGVEKDGERALEIFRDACDAENLTGCIRAAELHLYHVDTDYAPDKTVERYAEACFGGHDGACTTVSGLFRNGVHVEQSYERAVMYLERGCENDGAGSCDALEDYLRLGVGTDKDVARADAYARDRLDTYRDDCRENENESCAHAAHLIAHGRGTDTNWSKAREYLRAQCVHEVSAGCREQAEQQATGEIFERDREAAIASLEALCEDGVQNACVQAAYFLRVGHTDEIDIARSVELWTSQCKED